MGIRPIRWPAWPPAFATCRDCRAVVRERSGRLAAWLPTRTVLAFFVSCFLLQLVGNAQVKEVRRVLIIYESSPYSPLPNLVDQGIRTALEHSPYQVEFYHEHMETAAFPDPADQQLFRDFYLRKYQNRRPDLIIAVGPAPLEFMVETHKRSFPGIPVVFCLPNRIPSDFTVDSDFTGVKGDIAPAATLAAALRLRPGTQHVVVVGGTSPFDKQQNASITGQLKPFEDHLDISYLTDLTMPDLLERLKRLPSHTIVILGALGRDAAGTRFTLAESGPMVVAAANAPVFSLNDRALNHGEVGGNVSNALEQGKIAGGMALRILKGERPQDIQPVKDETTYMFDWQALKRWGMKESDLPPGSILLNRRPGVWESYKWFIIGCITLILLESLLLCGLVFQRRRRRKAENELAVTYDRFRLAVEAGRSVAWDWDVKSGRDRRFGDLETMFGIKSSVYSGRVEEFLSYIHPEDRDLVSKAIAGSREGRQPYFAEFRVVRPDGAVRWITAQGIFYYSDHGDPERMIGMAVDITERKRVEQELRESQDRLAGIVGSAMDAIIATDEDRRIVLFNNAAEKMFGCAQDEALGASIHQFIPQGLTAENRTALPAAGETRATAGATGELDELWAVRRNGQKFPIEASISHVRSDTRMLSTVIIRDITERRQAEESVRESEERFRSVANTAPVMIWMADADQLYTYLNKPWLDFTGRSIGAELGNGWFEGVHPEDLESCLDAYTQAFDRRESFQMQYRLRRHDGQYRWVFDTGVPRFNWDGSFAGFIGSCIDVTDRKLAEEALADMGRRLIEAHEEERTWIARELHDDINQRIAVLVNEVDMLEEGLPESMLELHDQVRQARQRLAELAGDIQSLSHRLHSSKLDYLGIAAAASSFCKEFSAQQKVEIDFSHAGIPRSVPKEISLCLFRILQESLQNAVKHSGVRQFRVELRRTANQIQLTVKDMGVGFDQDDAKSRHGLGLISMRERLQLVKGELFIKSERGGGTTIYARIPFKEKEYDVSLASEK